ncbi:MAG: radical SAM protein [Candidatus Methanoperedens sp.]
MNILLVEPDFPYPTKSKNKADHIHKNFVPIGLLKFGSLHKAKGDVVKLVRGKKNSQEIGFIPDKIFVTSLFTYWSSHVWDCIGHYRVLFPDSEINLGGVYATLHIHMHEFNQKVDEFRVMVLPGIHPEAEKYLPDYSLLAKVDYHATHMMRGCIRRCKFCGTWKIEPKRTNKTKDEIIDELKQIGKNRIIFYDNNILANPHIKDILEEFSELKLNGRPIIFESQSGFDGRLLEKDPELAELIKKARFQNIRIAWDNGLEDMSAIKKQIKILVKAGYNTKDISVFMIYNFDIPYEDMIKKLKHCKTLGVQITDCRYRPLEIDYDNYLPHMRNGQPEGNYYIHKKAGWTDQKIRNFRKQVRQHNIWVRYAKDKGLEYNPDMEKWSAINNTFKFFKLEKPPYMEKIRKNKKILQRIKKLNKMKKYYIDNKMNPPDLS